MKFLITKNSFHSPVTLKKLLYIFTLGYIIISVDLEFSVFFIVPSFFVIFFCRKKNYKMIFFIIPELCVTIANVHVKLMMFVTKNSLMSVIVLGSSPPPSLPGIRFQKKKHSLRDTPGYLLVYRVIR